MRSLLASRSGTQPERRFSFASGSADAPDALMLAPGRSARRRRERGGEPWTSHETEDFPGFEGFALRELEVPDRGFGRGPALRFRTAVRAAAAFSPRQPDDARQHGTGSRSASRPASPWWRRPARLRRQRRPRRRRAGACQLLLPRHGAGPGDLMEALGYFALPGRRPRPGRAHRPSHGLDIPARVARAALIDILPSRPHLAQHLQGLGAEDVATGP